MWTTYSVLALVLSVIEGVIVALVVRWSARRGAGRVIEVSLRPVVEAETQMTHDGSAVAVLDPPMASATSEAGRGSIPIRFADLLLGAAVQALLWIASTTALVVTGVIDPFGVVNLAFFVAVVGLPLAAAILGVGVRRARRDERATDQTGRPDAMTKPAAVLLASTALFFPIGVYGSLIEPDRLDTEIVSGVRLAPGRNGHAPVRVGILSDIQTRHVGAHELAAVDRIMSLQPDVVLIAGDVFQSPDDYDAELPNLRAMFGRLRAPGGVYLVQGDADPPPTLEPMVQGTAVRILRDQAVRTKVGDRDVTIGGLELNVWADPSLDVVRELENTPGEGDIRILLSHRPDSVLRLPASTRVDLVAAGHTHGGQIAIPFFGPLVTLTDVPRSVAAGGFSELDGRRIYVSKGVGLERRQAPQFRFDVVPSVGLVELT